MYKALFGILLGILIVGYYIIFGKIKKQSMQGDRFSVPKYRDIENEMSNPEDKSLTTQLNELVEMKKEGIISEDQFQAKRKDIIENYMD